MTIRSGYNSNSSANFNVSGFYRGIVKSVGSGVVSLVIPNLSGHTTVYENIQYAGFLPAVDDHVWVNFIEGKAKNPLVFSLASDSAAEITSVVAGTALSGGGSSGAVTLNFAPSELSSVTVATDDKVVIADTSDSDNPKHVTAQSLANLASASPGGSPNQVQFNSSGSFGADANFTYDGSAVGLGATLTVGANDTGHDVKFYGASADHWMLWDESVDSLVLTQDSGIYFYDVGGEKIQAASNGHLNIDAGTTLDLTAPTIDLNASTLVNVDGNTQLNGTLTIGVNDTGHDVIFYGATATNAWFWWDESADNLLLGPATKLGLGTDATTPAATPLHLNNATPTLTISDTANNTGDGAVQCTIHMAGRYHSGTANPLADAYSDVKLVSFKDNTDGNGGSGFQIYTSASGAGGLQKAFEIERNGKTILTATANILSLVDDSNTNQSGYVGFYDSNLDRLGYVGYPANDDLYMKNEDADGDVYLWSENGRIYYFADTYHFWKVAGTYELRLDGSYLQPYADKGLSLGQPTKRWNVLYVNEIEADDGSASDPSYTFNGDEDTGMYATSNVLRFTTGGTQRGLFSSSGFYSTKSTISTGFTYATWNSDTGYLSSTSSSERYKENIQNMPKSEWEKVYQLQARTFDWKDDGSVELSHLGKSDFGLIAEEVNDVLPMYVSWDRESHADSDDELGVGNESTLVIQGLDYGKITTYLIEVVKDLKTRLEALES